MKDHPRSPSRHTAAHAPYLADALIARMVRLDVTAQRTPHGMTPEPSNELTADTTIGGGAGIRHARATRTPCVPSDSSNTFPP